MLGFLSDIIRSMDFGIAVLERLEKNSELSLVQVVEDAYEDTLKPWHGWISSAAYKVMSHLYQCISFPLQKYFNHFNYQPVFLQERLSLYAGYLSDRPLRESSMNVFKFISLTFFHLPSMIDHSYWSAFLRHIYLSQERLSIYVVYLIDGLLKESHINVLNFISLTFFHLTTMMDHSYWSALFLHIYLHFISRSPSFLLFYWLLPLLLVLLLLKNNLNKHIFWKGGKSFPNEAMLPIIKSKHSKWKHSEK